MRYRILGPLDVADSDGPVEVRGQRRVALLVRLIVSANEVVPVDRLAHDLWDGDPPSGVASTVSSHISILRRMLGPDRIVSRAGGYSLTVRPGELDADDFESTLVEARHALRLGSPHQAVEHFERALKWWRGGALADVQGASWAQAETGRLEELRRSATEALLEARLQLGQHEELVAAAEAAVAEEPLREQRWATLMLALYRSGRQADALRAYQRLRAILGDSLGIEPSPELAALEEAVILHKPHLAWAVPDGPGPGRDRPLDAPAGAGPPTNLPARVSSFVGRRAELADVDRLLDTERLVTLTGAGGSGKTRLAVEVAARRTDRHEDGVWLVDLATTGDGDGGVAVAVAAALGFSDEPVRPVVEALGEALRHRAALIVLDNCEHVLDASARLVATLVRGCDRLVVLATSREPLGVDGERRVLVSPLSLPPEDAALTRDLERSDAVELFVDRTRSQGMHLVLANANVRLVTAICRRLDGIALALELAAARTPSMSLADIDARLADRFQLLRDGRRDAPSRHETLWTTVDWSYQLLTEDERAVLRRLSAFAGSFDLVAATAVCAFGRVEEGRVPALVTSLVDKNLVVADALDSGARYRLLLHLDRREFAARCPATEGGDERGTSRSRFTDHFVELMGAVPMRHFGSAQFDAIAWQQAEWDNIAAAAASVRAERTSPEERVSMVVGLRPMWFLHRGEVTAAVTAALDEVPTTVDPARRIELLTFAAEVLVRSDGARALACGRDAVVLAEAVGDDELLVLADLGLTIAEGAAGMTGGGPGAGPRSTWGGPVLGATPPCWPSASTPWPTPPSGSIRRRRRGRSTSWGPSPARPETSCSSGRRSCSSLSGSTDAATTTPRWPPASGTCCWAPPLRC